MKRLIPIVVLLAVLGGGFYIWSSASQFETTDDAQIDGHINAVSSRISGNVLRVLAQDEAPVRVGDVLVEIDPSDYRVALTKAEADLADAEASVRSARADVPVTSIGTQSLLSSAKSGRVDASASLSGAQRQLAAAQARLLAVRARVRQSEANLQKATQDLARSKTLVDKDEISRQQYDAAVASAAASQADVESQRASVVEAEQNVVAAESFVEQVKARIAQADANIQSAQTGPQQVASKLARVSSLEAQVMQRRALVEQARLNLTYCTIKASVNGVVGKKTVEIGQNVSPGQQLLAIVPLDDIWVTANFKETQMRNVKPGQRVDLMVDAYGTSYKGRVERVAGATGSKYSLLPPENATGNYVKVVQRIPVRIQLEPGQDPDHKLRVGMSVTPKVYVK